MFLADFHCEVSIGGSHDSRVDFDRPRGAYRLNFTFLQKSRRLLKGAIGCWLRIGSARGGTIQ